LGGVRSLSAIERLIDVERIVIADMA